MSENKNIENIPLVQKPESQEIDEAKKESTVEKQTSSQTEPKKELVRPQIPTAGQLPVANTSQNTEPITLEKVENILSHGMDQVFLSMDASRQQEFKIKGEETAKQILTVLEKTKITVKDIISLIADWLRKIPNINQYYIEQEAKIKADAIINMHQKNQK